MASLRVTLQKKEKPETLEFNFIQNLNPEKYLKTYKFGIIKEKLIPLMQFITIIETSKEKGVYHYDAERSVTVYADIENDLLSSGEVNKKIKSFLEPQVEKTPDIRLFFGGEEKESQNH